MSILKKNKEKEELVTLRDVPKSTKRWHTVQLSRVQMFFPELHEIIPNPSNPFPKTKYSALLVIGNEGDAAYDAIAPLVIEMASKWFTKGGKAANIDDLGKNTFFKYQEEVEGKNISYVGEHFIQPKRDPKHGVVPVVDAQVKVMNSDQVALIGHGALVNARVSFGPFQVSKDVFGIMGTLDAIQVIKKGSAGGATNEDNVTQFFVPDADGAGFAETFEAEDSPY
jgi:hypothetical protein